MQSVDERGCRDIFTLVGNLGKLVLKIANIRLETVALSYFNGEKVVVIFFGLPMGGVLGEENVDYLLKIVERTWLQRIKTNLRPHFLDWIKRSST